MGYQVPLNAPALFEDYEYYLKRLLDPLSLALLVLMVLHRAQVQTYRLEPQFQYRYLALVGQQMMASLQVEPLLALQAEPQHCALIQE